MFRRTGENPWSFSDSRSFACIPWFQTSKSLLSPTLFLKPKLLACNMAACHYLGFTDHPITCQSPQLWLLHLQSSFLMYIWTCIWSECDVNISGKCENCCISHHKVFVWFLCLRGIQELNKKNVMSKTFYLNHLEKKNFYYSRISGAKPRKKSVYSLSKHKF